LPLELLLPSLLISKEKCFDEIQNHPKSSLKYPPIFNKDGNKTNLMEK